MVNVAKPVSIKGLEDGDKQMFTGMLVSSLAGIAVWWLFARKRLGVEGILKK